MRCIELRSPANRVRGRWIHRSVRKHCPKHLRSNCKWSKSEKNIFCQLIISDCKKNPETCKPPSFHSATAVWPVEAPIAQAAVSDYQSWSKFGNENLSYDKNFHRGLFNTRALELWKLLNMCSHPSPTVSPMIFCDQ